MQLPPGNFGLPIVGETFSFLLDQDFVLKRYQRYGGIFKTSLFGQPTVFFVGPEAVEFVLSSHFDSFSWKKGWPESFRVLLGESLFLQDGEEHRRNRRLMMPAFHGPALAGYFATMKGITQGYCQQWLELGEFQWFDQLKQLTFEIASQLLLGTETGEETERLSQLFDTLTQGLFTLLPVPVPGTKFGRAVAARNQILEHLTGVIAQRKQNPTYDALSLLIQTQDEEGHRMSDEEIRAQAMLMLFAGHETTTAMLTWCCLELARHPEIWRRAQAEQEQLAQSGDLTLEQLAQMPYLDQVMLEVERFHPPVGGGFRRVVKPVEFNGFQVPVGWIASYSIITTHYLPTVYTNPEQFDPDRFSPQRQEHKVQPYSLIGFGGGSRVCLGVAFAKLEMKIVMATLLRYYHWELLPNQSLEVVRVPTRRPQDKLGVSFSQLSN